MWSPAFGATSKRLERVSVVIDAADYFVLMQQAMLKRAIDRIFLIGWDFDTRIHLAHRPPLVRESRREPHLPFEASAASSCGWCVTGRELEIRILKWSIRPIRKFAFRGTGCWADLARWLAASADRLQVRQCPPHRLFSHHQKIVVLDNRVGGVRRDRHDGDPPLGHARALARTTSAREMPQRASYYGPWHDATMMLEGRRCARGLGGAGLATAGIRAGGKPTRTDMTRPRADSLWPGWLGSRSSRMWRSASARTRACPYRPPWDRGDARSSICSSSHIMPRPAVHLRRKPVLRLPRHCRGDRGAEWRRTRSAGDSWWSTRSNADGWLEHAGDGPRPRPNLIRRQSGRHDQKRPVLPLGALYRSTTSIYVHAKIDDRR